MKTKILLGAIMIALLSSPAFAAKPKPPTYSVTVINNCQDFVMGEFLGGCITVQNDKGNTHNYKFGSLHPGGKKVKFSSSVYDTLTDFHVSGWSSCHPDFIWRPKIFKVGKYQGGDLVIKIGGHWKGKTFITTCKATYTIREIVRNIPCYSTGP